MKLKYKTKKQLEKEGYTIKEDRYSGLYNVKDKSRRLIGIMRSFDFGGSCEVDLEDIYLGGHENPALYKTPIHKVKKIDVVDDHKVFIADTGHVQIGCEYYTPAQFRRLYEKVGRAVGYEFK